jgi:hypothetical protein
LLWEIKKGNKASLLKMTFASFLLEIILSFLFQNNRTRKRKPRGKKDRFMIYKKPKHGAESKVYESYKTYHFDQLFGGGVLMVVVDVFV